MMTLQKMLLWMTDNGDAHFPQWQVDDSHTANNRAYIKMAVFKHKERTAEKLFFNQDGLLILVGLKLL